MTLPIEQFYRNLIKSPLSLSTRYQLGNILSDSYRLDQADKWQSIITRSDILSKPLKSLRACGFLPLSFPYSSGLASELCKIPHSGVANQGPGRRTEIENLNSITHLEGIKSILNDPLLYSLVSLYLGAPAHLHTCQAWWQYPMDKFHKPSNAQLWHRDRDDLTELKMFFYATNVDMSCGPHAFIEGSHSPEGLSRIFPSKSLQNPIINGTHNSFVDDSFFREQGLTTDFKIWQGPAGTCFLEDTRGFHRAYLPTENPRLIMSLVWTVGPGW